MTTLPDHEEEQRASITVFGDVQGVFFRRSTKQRADQLKLRGFARNEPDGTVYIEAEGNKYDLQDFIRWVKKGSESASISSVDVEYGELKNHYQFTIR